MIVYNTNCNTNGYNIHNQKREKKNEISVSNEWRRNEENEINAYKRGKLIDRGKQTKG